MRMTASQLSFAYEGSPRFLFEKLEIDLLQGSITALTGPSGSGKSTLLDILGAARDATAGAVHLYGDENEELTRQEHKSQCAWVLQSNLVLSKRTVLDNVTIGAFAHGRRGKEVHDEAHQVLEVFGLADKAKSKVNSLSGGEQQRVTIARCLLAPTRVILADEPTGNLDHENTQLVGDCLRTAAESGKIVIVATHDEAIVKRCDEVVDLAARSSNRA
ncbi:ATP-binding cassette domain-containing protein [Microbacterium maritypicum]|uniref:ABC transporter ATP-binding protein n=1 Tax=Microbacterium maritypicum TaxID=33918 RepID=UPI003ED154B6